MSDLNLVKKGGIGMLKKILIVAGIIVGGTLIYSGTKKRNIRDSEPAVETETTTE